MVGKLSTHPSILIKDAKENCSIYEELNFFVHETRFEVSAPGPLQSISAKVVVPL